MTTKQTILPMLALVASIAIMTLPTALADEGERLTITELEALIIQAEDKILFLNTNSELKEVMKLQTQTSINAHQDKLDRLDAIVDSGIELTADEADAYEQHQNAITYLDEQFVVLQESIDTHETQIVLHEEAIVNLQSIIDSRNT